MEEAYKVTRLMKEVWKMTPEEIVPSFQLKATSNFGVVLVAVTDKNPDEIVGFIYSVPNFDEKHYKHYSHMMGVKPKMQSKGLGYFLKLAHRKIALDSTPKVHSIEWTVDPLISRNAKLNFGKLGCITRTYKENYFGTSSEGGVFSSIPTDRFILSWVLESENVKAKIANPEQKKIEFSSYYSQNLFLNSLRDGEIIVNQISDKEINEKGICYLEIPYNFPEIKDANKKKASKIRINSRAIFIEMFEKGWVINDFLVFNFEKNIKRCFYKFTR